jgi:small conductance mechanosensitive channel
MVAEKAGIAVCVTTSLQFFTGGSFIRVTGLPNLQRRSVYIVLANRIGRIVAHATHVAHHATSIQIVCHLCLGHSSLQLRGIVMDLNWNTVLDTYLIPWGTKIVMALLVFVIGRWIALALTRALRSIMTRSSVDPMLVGFLGNIVKMALLAVVVLATLEQLGVNTTSALAILGAAGLAVGLALKDSLSSFAAGVMLIIFRPFKLGDFVEAGGTSGVVEDIRIFHTVLRTGDNREITMPNAQIYSGTIINYSARDTRRIDLVIGIGYEDDMKKAQELIRQVLEAESTLLKDPAPTVMLLELGESSVDFAVRPWVKSSDYWTTRAALLENIKTVFDREGINIPYPQRDVHLYQVASN